MGYLYILQSLLNSKYYIGSTINIEKRFSEHVCGYVKSTKNLRPLKLMFFKQFETIKIARQFEYKLKKFKSKKIIEKIIQEKDIKFVL